jgi:cytochrome c oxidase subunit 3
VAADSSALIPPVTARGEGRAHAQHGTSNPILGMALFIVSEVMFFAGLFAAYFNVRFNAEQWPPLVNGQPFDGFSLHTVEHVPVAATLTAILVLSSVTLQLAVRAIRRGDRRAFLRATAVTLALGVAFLAGQLWDYSGMRFGITDTAFGSTFFTLTGFHAAHVLGGAVMLGAVLYRGMAGQFSAKHHDLVEATSIYWHFVDAVWIALFATLYLL